VEEDDRVIRSQSSIAHIGDQRSEGFGRVDRIEQNAFGPGKQLDRLKAFRSR
jgi:hypothetical protein